MFAWFRRQRPQEPVAPAVVPADGYSRVAVGDLLVDLELPVHFRRDYEESGCLAASDESGDFTLRISGITVRGKDPAARDLGARGIEIGAVEHGVQATRLSEWVAWYAYSEPSTWEEGPARNDYWIAGVGNRRLVLTLSYLEARAAALDLPQLHAIAVRAIRSTAPTYPEQPGKTDELLTFDLQESQRAWFDYHRRDLRKRIQATLGWEGDGLVPLDVLDEYWDRFVAAPPASNDAVNAILNGVGVLFGDHLVHGRNWQWIILHDSYGVCLAVIALRGTANLNTDPFNYVTKRWERKETSFLENGYMAMCQLTEEWAEKWRGK